MKKYLALASTALLLAACNDRFLEQVPVSERSEANFYRTTDDYYNAVVGVYSTLKNGGLYGSGSGAIIAMTEIISDNTDLGVTRQAQNAASFEMEDLLITITNASVTASWTGHYQGIARANAILDRLPNATSTLR